MTSLAVQETDIRAFAVALQAYRVTCQVNGDAADEMEIVQTYPDIEYKLARDIAAVFGHNLFCVEYAKSCPGFTDRRSIFIKNIARGTTFFRPVWTAAHELCHLIENEPLLHQPALEELKKVVLLDAWEKRRAIEDDDIGNVFRNLSVLHPPKEIDRSPERQAYIWNEVMADCYASMWSEPFFWDGVLCAHASGSTATDVIETIERLREANSVAAIDSYPVRIWYPPENRARVCAIMTDLTAAFLTRH